MSTIIYGHFENILGSAICFYLIVGAGSVTLLVTGICIS